MLRVMLLSILFALIVNPAVAQNLVTFEYSGPEFTNVVSGTRFTTSDSISGAFTIDCDAIPATVDCRSLPLANYTAAVTSFSFTATGSPDLTITSSDVSVNSSIVFSTGGNCDISDAALFLGSALPAESGSQMNVFTNGGYVVSFVGGLTDASFNGVWATIPTPVPPKPVPVLSAWGNLLTISLLAALGALVPSHRRAGGAD